MLFCENVDSAVCLIQINTTIMLSLNKIEINYLRTYMSLFRSRKFMLDKMTLQNASKFAIFLEYEIPCSFSSVFHFKQFYFSPNGCFGLCRNRPGRVLTWVFSVFKCQKYSKFWSILQGHFIKHKLLISEECVTYVVGISKVSTNF